ncbi:MAG: hypothetical protein JNL98_40440 [Bryobacterales bacterium]|nr:hypothetical protein [Bryobacterales bacterium]
MTENPSVAGSAETTTPGRYVDPDGKAPVLAAAFIGFAAGAGGELFSQWQAGAGYDWQKVAAKGVGSAVFGIGIGLTVGASLPATVFTGAGASLAGGVTERAIDGDAESEALDSVDLTADIAAGLAGGAAGHVAQALLRAKLPLPEWAKIQLRQAKRLRRIARWRVNSRPTSAATLTEKAANTESFIDKVFYVWPASAARGGTKTGTKAVVKSTIRYFAPDEEIPAIPPELK